MAITPLSLTDFTNKTMYPTIPANNDAMREQLSGPPNDIANYINEKMIPNIADISGWTPLTATFSLNTADAPIFVANTSIDVSSILYPGVRVKLTQDSATKYFIVIAVSGVSVTLYGGTDYTLTSSTITNIYYSNVKAPLGFPLNVGKWTYTYSNTTFPTQSGPATGTWYNPGGLSLTIPQGLWDVTIKANVQAAAASATAIEAALAFSSLSNDISDPKMVGGVEGYGTGAGGTVTFRQMFNLPSDSLFYFIVMSRQPSAAWIGIKGSYDATIVMAVCAYL